MNPYEISKWKAEFKDKKKEEAYVLDYMGKSIAYVKKAVVLLGALNLTFLVPDYLVVHKTEAYWQIFSNRLFFVFSMAAIYQWLREKENLKDSCKGILLIELLTGFLFLHVYWVYEPAHFFIQAMGMMTLMTVFATVHNRWIYTVASNAFLLAGFFFVTVSFKKTTDPMEMIAVLCFSVIMGSLMLIASHQMHVFQRRRHADRMALKRLSVTDGLTRLFNRFKFEEDLDRAIDRWNRYGRPFSLVMIDADNFKSINDTHGHMTGDRVLQCLADILRREVRVSDLAARWGGEEFVVILPETRLDEAMSFVARLRKTIKRTIFEGCRITCSYGISEVRPGDDSASVLRRADACLYRAKRKGRDCWVNDAMELPDAETADSSGE